VVYTYEMWTDGRTVTSDDGQRAYRTPIAYTSYPTTIANYRPDFPITFNNLDPYTIIYIVSTRGQSETKPAVMLNHRGEGVWKRFSATKRCKARCKEPQYCSNLSYTMSICLTMQTKSNSSTCTFVVVVFVVFVVFVLHHVTS
jgi:hypothetical protein